MVDPILALVGGETLLGADLRDMAAERIPSARIHLVGSEEQDTAILTEQGGEAVVMTGLDADRLAGARVVLLAGSQAASRKALDLLKDASPRPAILDLTHALDDAPEARLLAPWVLPDKPPAGAGPIVIPHPAAIVVARILRALQAQHRVVRAVAQVLVPASERGRMGVNELQEQTVSLLSFQPPVMDVFGGQLSFNLLASGVAETERRVESHIATLLAGGPVIPMPSMRFLQAGVMHGYSFSLWVELDNPEGVMESLKTAGLDVWPDDPPHVVGIAGQDGVSIGRIERDRNNARAVWIWAVADQFRVACENAIVLAEAAL